MTSSRRSSSSRIGPLTSPRWRIRSGALGSVRARRLFTSAASAEMEEVGGNGIKRRIGAAPGGATVTVYRTWDMVRGGWEKQKSIGCGGAEESHYIY
jgi:hypothetical protein